jgi:hypothetical protein
MLPGVSKAFKPRGMSDGVWDNSGFGLYMAGNICTSLNGSFLIASGNSCISKRFDYHTRNIVTKTYPTRIDGTAIRMTISTDRIREYQNIQKQLIREGEEQSRKMRNTVKNASRSSKGLTEFLE